MALQAAVVAVVGVAGLLVVACVGDTDDAGEGGTATPTTRIEVETSEFEFEPDRWTVPAGDEVVVEVRNGGAVAHEWVVMRLGEEAAADAPLDEAAVLFEVEEVAPGSSREQRFTVDDPGSYQVICGVPGHLAAGMEGELEVG